MLPAGPGASIPLSSVNTDKAKATIYRIGDRGISQAIRDGRFLSQLSSYSADDIANSTGEQVWQGEILIKSEVNETQVTAIPIADALPEMKPGAYVITAEPAVGDTEEWGPVATQWFIVSDLGLTALSGSDGIHAVVRSLSTAKAVAGATVRLVALNNDVLGETTTNEDGIATFEPGLARGTGGAAPQLVVAETGSDYGFLDLTRAAFDLTDRGVTGRPSPGPLDVFLTPERGIYRPGEIIHLTGLVRDERANAVGDLPLTLVVERPDGVEYLRKTLSDGGLGGYSEDVTLQDNAMRGAWHARLYADPKGSALADATMLVEDFEPERLAVDLSTDATGFDRTRADDDQSRRAISLRRAGAEPRHRRRGRGEAGHHAGRVPRLHVRPRRRQRRGHAAADRDRRGHRRGRQGDVRRDDAGPPLLHPAVRRDADRARHRHQRSRDRTHDRQAGAGRWRRRSASSRCSPTSPKEPPRGSRRFSSAPDGTRLAKPGVPWKLERITNELPVVPRGRLVELRADHLDQQGRQRHGRLHDGRCGDRSRANVDWGDYRLTIEDTDGDTPAASSYEFYAGWYQAVASSDTPDTLRVGLDKPSYAIGETAKLRLDPRFAGIAVVSVIDDRLIDMKAVEVPEGGTTVDLPVTEKWGPGAYITATLYRPMDIEAKRMPARALGLAWAKVAPGDRQLDVKLDLPDEMRPRGPMAIPVSIDNLPAGAEAYVTVAAVDVGILNLTNFKAPAPDDWYFGQRQLGMEIRDLYGLLIDRMQGVPGEVRSGGDSEAVRLKAPPPTQKLLAFYSGIMQGRRRRQGVGDVRPAGLQRLRARDGDGVDEGRRRPRFEGRVRARSRRGHGQHSALPFAWRHIAASGRDQQRLRCGRRLPAIGRDRRRHRDRRRGRGAHRHARRKAEGGVQHSDRREGVRRFRRQRQPRLARQAKAGRPT